MTTASLAFFADLSVAAGYESGAGADCSQRQPDGIKTPVSGKIAGVNCGQVNTPVRSTQPGLGGVGGAIGERQLLVSGPFFWGVRRWRGAAGVWDSGGAWTSIEILRNSSILAVILSGIPC